MKNMASIGGVGCSLGTVLFPSSLLCCLHRHSSNALADWGFAINRADTTRGFEGTLHCASDALLQERAKPFAGADDLQSFVKSHWYVSNKETLGLDEKLQLHGAFD